MYFEKSITILADTPKNDPKRVQFTLRPGKLIRVGISFPRGCHDMVHVTVRQGKFQLFPLNVSGDVAANGDTIWMKSGKEIVPGRHILTILGWSPDTRYNHNIRVRFEFEDLPREVENA